MPDDERKDFLTIPEIAKELHIGRATVWRLIKLHNIKRWKIPGQGKNTYISRKDFPKLTKPIPKE